MLFFDPTDARAERAAQKNAISISLVWQRAYMSDNEEGPKQFSFKFMESEYVQMVSDYAKEDGIYLKHKIQM